MTFGLAISFVRDIIVQSAVRLSLVLKFEKLNTSYLVQVSYVEPAIGLPIYSSDFDNAELSLNRWSRFRQLHHIRDLQSLASIYEIGFDWRVIGDELVPLFYEVLDLGPVEYFEAKVHPRSVNVNLITSNETLGARIE